MQTTIQIIEEIKGDAANLQRKLLTLPAPGERDISKEQYKAIDKAQDGLSGWRGWDLGKLEKAFSSGKN